VRIFTVNGLGEDLRAGGLTRSARAAEKVGVRGLSLFDLIFENIGNLLLAANVVKVKRAPFSV
jgi:hypothetical protein